MSVVRAPRLVSPRPIEKTILQCALGVALVLIALALKKLLEPITGTGAPFVLFFGAVAVASLALGPLPAICIAILSLPLGAHEFVVRAGYSQSQAAFQAALFGVDCILVVTLSLRITRSRERVEKAEERLRLANAAAAIYSWDLDVTSGHLEWSTDRPIEGAPDNPDDWLRAIHPDDRAAFARALRLSLDPLGDGKIRFEGRVGRAGEPPRWFSWVGRTRFERRGSTRVAVRQLGTAIEITDRHRREEERRRVDQALRESEERFRLTFESAPIGMALVALDGRFVRVNRALTEIVGYTAAELEQRRFQDITHPDDRDGDVALANQLARGELQRYQREKHYFRKDGSIVTILLSVSVLRTSEGTARYYISQIEDVSLRRRVESEQLLLAEAGAVLVSSLDYERTLAGLAALLTRELADFCIIEVNGARGRLRVSKVVCADPAQSGLCAELERGTTPLVRHVLEAGRRCLLGEVELRQLDALAESDDERRLLAALSPRSLIGLPMSLRGELLGALVLVSSTPTRIYGAADLRFAEVLAERAALAIENGRLYLRALEAMQLRDQVLRVVAHDLRNPLSTILVQSTALERRGPEPERRSQKPKENLERAARRMNRLIQDLLDVSRIEAGELGLQRAPIAAGELLVESVEAQRPLAQAAGIALALEPPAPLLRAEADPHRLLQVLENLIGNALKFTHSGGHVTVGALSRGDEVLFHVSDDGCGISVEDQTHVFDPFWQAKKGTRQGAGLGLPISRGIVEAHGGHIWLESAPGRGSRFSFTIPRA